MTASIIELVFLPTIVFFAILASRRYTALQMKRIEDYRRSPDSRLIKLND